MTREGEATLSGIARNAAEKSLVTKLVEDVYGATGVKNQMTVEEAGTKLRGAFCRLVRQTASRWNSQCC